MALAVVVAVVPLRVTVSVAVTAEAKGPGGGGFRWTPDEAALAAAARACCFAVLSVFLVFVVLDRGEEGDTPLSSSSSG